MQGDGEWRLWSVCNSSSLLFLPPHSAPCPSWVPPTGCNSCRINLLQHGVSTRFSSFRKHPPAPAWCSPWAAVWTSAPLQSVQGLHGNRCLGAWDTSSLSFCSDVVAHRAVSHTFFSFFLTTHLLHSVLSFLKYFFPRFHHLGRMAQPCPWWIHWNWLCPAWSSLSISSQQLPCSSPPPPGHPHPMRISRPLKRAIRQNCLFHDTFKGDVMVALPWWLDSFLHIPSCFHAYCNQILPQKLSQCLRF